MATAVERQVVQPFVVPVAKIDPSGTNPRKHIDPDQLEELALSVQTHGILQPLLVRPGPAGRYGLVAGERRLRAAEKAGLAEVPVLVRELTDAEVLEVQVIDNLQRADLHPLEEADGYRLLMSKAGYEVAKIAERVGRSVAYVYDALKLLSLTKDAQALFRDGSIQKGHAVILARLEPADQARAIGTPGNGPLLFEEHLLWKPDEERTEQSVRRHTAVKPVSVRELQAWVDKNVRFDRDDVDAMLFPETALAVAPQLPAEKAEKIIPITHDHYVTPEAKVEGERTFGPMSWRRADGKHKSKTCDRSVTGVIVVGPGRGEAFKVCIDKKGCTTHWGAEKRAATKRAAAAAKGGKTGEDRYAIEERKRQEERKREEALRVRWKKALPAILTELASALKKAPARAKGHLAEIILGEINNEGYGNEVKAAHAAEYLPLGNTAEDLVRHAAFLSLAFSAGDVYSAPRDFPKRAKAFGIDVQKILDEVAPAEAAAPTKEQPEKRKKRGR